MTSSSHLAREVVIDETIDVLDADGNIVAESETIEVIETGD